MRWNDDLLAGFDLSQKSKAKEVKEKSKEKREKIPGTDFINFLIQDDLKFLGSWTVHHSVRVGPTQS